jgi:hypothetical protein
MKAKTIIFSILILFIFSSCLEQVNIESCLTGNTYSFWGGLWHGIIAPVNLIAMIFNDQYTVFAQNNSGAWYAFGFILGSGGWGFLGSFGKKKHHKEEA